MSDAPTRTSDTMAEPAALQGGASRGYWQIVWRQFRRHTPAMIGLGMVVLLFLLAVFAPLLANNVPYFWYTESEGLSFPLFRALTNGDLIILTAFAFVVLVPVTRRILRRTGWLFWHLHELRRAVAVNLALWLLCAAVLVNLSVREWDFPPMRHFKPHHLIEVLLVAAVLLVRPCKGWLARRIESWSDRRLTALALGVNALAAVTVFCLWLRWVVVPVADRLGAAGVVPSMPVLVGVVCVVIGGLAAVAVALAGATRRGLRLAFRTDHAGVPALVLNLLLFAAAGLLISQYPFKPVPIPVLCTLSKWQTAGAIVGVIIALVPVTLWLLGRQGRPPAGRRRTAIGVHGYLMLLVVLLFTNARVVPSRIFEDRPAVVDGKAVTVRMERDYRKEAAEGAEATYLFPPIRFAPSDILAGAKFETPSADHMLGTDRLGRNTAARVIFGTRVSLAVGFISVGISVLIGIVIGGVSGYCAGWVDLVLQRFVEIFICFPSFFLMLTIIALFGPKLWLIMVVIGITRWTGTARFIRAEMLRVKELDYVTAARGLGLRPFAVIMRHALPNSIAPVLVSATFGIASAVGVEVTLSFLGLGDPDYPSWGLLLQQARSVAMLYPSLLIIPGVTIFFAVLAYNLVGEGLRDAIDPRLKV